MSDSYEYSTDTEVIVKQLTTLLDYLDLCYENNKFKNNCTYTDWVSELSMCLKSRHNMNLLPYVYILERYQDDEQCFELLQNVYYTNHKVKISDRFQNHFC